MSCLAPVLYASTDCSRWLAEYKQGILQRRATRRLREAKFRLTAMVRKPAPVHTYPVRHRMGPLESLHRFQIDCGDLDETPEPTPGEPVLPKLPVEPVFALVSFPEAAPDLPAPSEPLLVADVPTLINVPTTPVENLPVSAVTPEPASLMLVCTGVLLGTVALRRRRGQTRKPVALAA